MSRSWSEEECYKYGKILKEQCGFISYEEFLKQKGDFMNKHLEFEEIVKLGKTINRMTSAKKYWKLLVLGTLENMIEIGKQYKITEQDINNIVDDLMDNDNIINVIDEEICYELSKFKVKEKENEN